MTLTRANIESMLIRRLGKSYDFIGLDGHTVDGSNEDMNDPIGYALRQLGYSVSDPTSISDADVAQLAVEHYDAALDLAELRGLQTWLGNNTLVSFRLGPRSEELSDLITVTEKRAVRLQAALEKTPYGSGVSWSLGTLTLDFAQHMDDTAPTS